MIFVCRYTRNGRKRPARLPYSFYKWIPIVYRYTQDEVIDLAGMDAAMYLRILMFGMASSPISLSKYSHVICMLCTCASIVVAVDHASESSYTVTHCCETECLLAGAELFFFLTIWCLIVVLPTNLSVSYLASSYLLLSHACC